MLNLILWTFSIWRITHLLACEKGPYLILERLRNLFPGELKKLVSCFFCASIWISLPVIYFFGILEYFALNGAVCLLFKLTNKETK